MYRGWTQTDYQNKHYNINRKWLQHVRRMDTNRLPKQALQYKPKVATTCTEDGHRLPKLVLQYKPKGRRNIGRPRKRWRDQLHLEIQGTGNTPKPSWTWWWWRWWILHIGPFHSGPRTAVSQALLISLTRSAWIFKQLYTNILHNKARISSKVPKQYFTPT